MTHCLSHCTAKIDPRNRIISYFDQTRAYRINGDIFTLAIQEGLYGGGGVLNSLFSTIYSIKCEFSEYLFDKTEHPDWYTFIKKIVWIWLTGIFRENRKFTTRTVIGSHHDLLTITGAGTVIRFATGACN